MSSLTLTATRLPIRSYEPSACAAPILAPALSANGLSTDWVQLDPRVSSNLWRSDMAHAHLRALGSSLTWTAIVTPASPSQLQSNSSAVHVGLGQAERTNSPKPTLLGPRRSVQSAPSVRQWNATPSTVDAPLGMVRQRFYPAQWQMAVRSRIENRIHGMQQGVRWVGWDRSLPRMYLSAEILTAVVVDLIELVLRKTSPLPAVSSALSIRVGWQSGATQRLVLVISHPQFQLSANQSEAINSSSAQTALQLDPFPTPDSWSRVFASVRSLSGSLTTAKDVDGGTLLRLSLPIDDRATLIESWLEQVQASRLQAQAGLESELRLSMVLLGRREAASSSQLDAIDGRVQSLAGAGDFVYRAARSRWLWLTTQSTLPGALTGAAWRNIIAAQWAFSLGVESAPSQQLTERQEIANQIATAMNRVLGGRVPPLDDLQTSLKRLRLIRLDGAESTIPGPAQPKPATRAHRPHQTPAFRRRWRYPI